MKYYYLVFTLYDYYFKRKSPDGGNSLRVRVVYYP